MSKEQHPKLSFTDYVGRPRKLSAGAILAIISAYERGVGTRDLAERYGVSTSLIRTVVWHSRKGIRK